MSIFDFIKGSKQERKADDLFRQMNALLFPNGEIDFIRDCERVESLVHGKISGPDLRGFVGGCKTRLMDTSGDTEEELLESILRRANGRINETEAYQVYAYFEGEAKELDKFSRHAQSLGGKLPPDLASYVAQIPVIRASGVTTDVIPKGTGEYGLDERNPIPTISIAGSNRYLDNLRFSGQAVKAVRLGSKISTISDGSIDIYSITVNGAMVATVYITPYHKRNSRRAPSGFTLIGGFTEPSASSVSSTVVNGGPNIGFSGLSSLTSGSQLDEVFEDMPTTSPPNSPGKESSVVDAPKTGTAMSGVSGSSKSSPSRDVPDVNETETAIPSKTQSNWMWIGTTLVATIALYFWINNSSGENDKKTSLKSQNSTIDISKDPLKNTTINLSKNKNGNLEPIAPPNFTHKTIILKDGFTSGAKIHMLGGKNVNKPYVGFILNIKTKMEDSLILSGNYVSAFQIYRQLSDDGDTTASHNVGLMLIRGMGVNKDIKNGMLFLDKSMADLSNYATSEVYYKKASKELMSNK